MKIELAPKICQPGHYHTKIDKKNLKRENFNSLKFVVSIFRVSVYLSLFFFLPWERKINYIAVCSNFSYPRGLFNGYENLCKDLIFKR